MLYRALCGVALCLVAACANGGYGREHLETAWRGVDFWLPDGLQFRATQSSFAMPDYLDKDASPTAIMRLCR